MKKLFPFFILILFAACREKGSSEEVESGNLLENLSYSVDTVIIDSGEELFNLSGLIHLEYQSPNLLYFFDEKQSKIQKINLDNRALLSTFRFEKEGPNGTGTYLSNFQSLKNDHFLIVSDESQGIFKSDGTKKLDLRLSNFSDNESETSEEIQLPFEMQLSPDGTIAYALVGDFFEGIWNFVRVNLKEKSIKTWEMPELLSSRNYTIMLMSDDGFDLRAEDIHLDIINEKVMITIGNTSSIYHYDPATDSLQFFDFPHVLTAKEKTGRYPLEVNSKEEYEEIVKEISSEITYDKFVWDSSRSNFFRIGRKTIRDSKKSEVFLYAYNKNLDLIGEQKIEGLDQTPKNYFFKDGKLYSYVNVEDELGFAVFTFDF